MTRTHARTWPIDTYTIVCRLCTKPLRPVEVDSHLAKHMKQIKRKAGTDDADGR